LVWVLLLGYGLLSLVGLAFCRRAALGADVAKAPAQPQCEPQQQQAAEHP